MYIFTQSSDCYTSQHPKIIISEKPIDSFRVYKQTQVYNACIGKYENIDGVKFSENISVSIISVFMVLAIIGIFVFVKLNPFY